MLHLCYCGYGIIYNNKGSRVCVGCVCVGCVCVWGGGDLFSCYIHLLCQIYHASLHGYGMMGRKTPLDSLLYAWIRNYASRIFKM